MPSGDRPDAAQHIREQAVEQLRERRSLLAAQALDELRLSMQNLVDGVLDEVVAGGRQVHQDGT